MLISIPIIKSPVIPGSRHNVQTSCPQNTQCSFGNRLLKDTVSFEPKDLLEQSKEEITTKIKASLIPKNFIASGGEAEVYKIEDSNYCIRIPYKHENNIIISNTDALLNSKREFSINTNISKMDSINHVKARLKNGCTIMEYIEGTPVASPYMSPEEIKAAAQIISEAPVESYSKLLKQICEAYRYNMFFDCTNFNVIVNPKTKTFTAVDFYKAEFPESLHPLGHIFTALTNDKTTIKQQKTCAGKIFKACIDELKSDTKPCTHITNFDFYRFIYRLGNTKIIENQNYTNLLCQIFSEIEELKLKELRGQDVTKILNGKLKMVNALVKQLFNVV